IEDNRDAVGRLFQRRNDRCAAADNEVRCRTHQFRRVWLDLGEVAGGKSMLDLNVAVFHPSKSFKSLPNPGDAGLHFGIVLGRCMQEHAAPYPYPLALLRAPHERPRYRCAAEQRDELAASHSITSSAVICMIIGTVRPSALAVLRLIVSANLVGCTTGKSPGLVPLRTRPT